MHSHGEQKNPLLLKGARETEREGWRLRDGERKKRGAEREGERERGRETVLRDGAERRREKSREGKINSVSVCYGPENCPNPSAVSLTTA